MSALIDHLHAFASRFTSVGRKDIEEIVTAVEDHLKPMFADAVAAAKTDEKVLAEAVAAEVAKILGHQPAPVPTPAPAEPPAAG